MAEKGGLRGRGSRLIGAAQKRVRRARPTAGEPEPHGRNKWRRFQLPKDMRGMTFLDVGCWEGANCAEATRRGAERAVGIDLCTSDGLRSNVEEFGFEFLQMDVFSEKWLELGRFDVVLCSGVLYHVENVISLLFRLRMVTGRLLALETAVRDVPGYEREPILVFKPSDERTRNPSNWWFPNRACLEEMLRTCGFDEPAVVWQRDRPGGGRVCIQAKPVERHDYERVLPRKQQAMSLAGGARYYDDNLGTTATSTPS